jgi:hypothetical protein
LGNFSSSPTVSASWNLEQSSRPSRLPGAAAWSILAVDSAADNVLLTTETSQGWQLWLASVATPPVQIALFADRVIAAFANTTATAFVVDISSHQVLRVTGLSGTPALTSVFSSDTYLADPVALALASDDSGLFVADPRAKLVRVFSPTTGTLLQELPTSSPVASFTAFSPGLFVLNSSARSPQPFWFLVTGQPGGGQPAKLSFVPRGQ